MLKRCVGFAFGLLAAPSVAWGGAWTLPQGTGQWLATLSSSTSTEVFDRKWALTPVPRYDKDEFQVLIEYGLTDRLTAIFAPGLQHIDMGAPIGAERSGLDQTVFGARYAFLTTPSWVVSGEATLWVPGTTDTSNPAAIGYTDVEADLRALVGHNFHVDVMPAFFDLEVAERARTNGYPGEFRLDGTLGLQVLPQWMLLAQSFNVVSEGSGNPAYGGSYEYHKLQLSALYTLTTAWWLQFGGFSTYAGRDALQENGAILGVWHQF